MAYHIGDDIPLSFSVLVDGKPRKPAMVSINLYNPDNKQVLGDGVKTKTSEINYVIDKQYIDIPGKYVAVFNVTLPYYGDKGHVIKFDVGQRNVPAEVNASLSEKLRI